MGREVMAVESDRAKNGKQEFLLRFVAFLRRAAPRRLSHFLTNTLFRGAFLDFEPCASTGASYRLGSHVELSSLRRDME